MRKILFIFLLLFSSSAFPWAAGTYTVKHGSVYTAQAGDPLVACTNPNLVAAIKSTYGTTLTNIVVLPYGTGFSCSGNASLYGGAATYFWQLGTTHTYSTALYVDPAQAAADAAAALAAQQAAAAAQAAADLAASQAAAAAVASGTTGTAPAYASPELVTAINSVTSAISTSGSATNGALASTNTNLSALNGSLLGINTSLQSVASALVPSTDSAGATSAFTSGLEMGSKIVGLMLLAWGFVVIRKVL